MRKAAGTALCCLIFFCLAATGVFSAEVLVGDVPERAEETEMETEKETNGYTVVIDPGHQGSWVDMSAEEPNGPGSSEMKAKASTGTQGTFSGVPEYELNLEVSLVLRGELEARGYAVVLTREDNDTAISNKERAELAASVGADIAVRIHANGSSDASADGALTMAPSEQNAYVPELSAESVRLSEEILSAYCAATGIRSLGVTLTDTMTGINWSSVPVTIVEMGFMTNQSDDLYITDEAHYPVMAKGIADGIDAYFAETSADTKLSDLETKLRTEFLDGKEAAGEKWAAAVCDLNSGAEISVNGEKPMQSASVIKLFIMAAVYERAVCAGELGLVPIDLKEAYEGETTELLTSMITVSDNESANELVRRLGGGDFEEGARIVNAFCAEHGYEQTHLGRAFLAENTEDDNYVSAKDCMELLAALYRGELVTQTASDAMLALLRQQTRTEKIPAGVPEGVETANKTGEMAAGYGLGTIENDAAIVWAEGSPYVLVLLSNDIAGNGEAQSTIVNISSEVYACFTES